MSSAQAKLFEWHRLLGEIERAEAQLRHASRPDDEDSQALAKELLCKLQRLRSQSDEMLAELDRLRSPH